MVLFLKVDCEKTSTRVQPQPAESSPEVSIFIASIVTTAAAVLLFKKSLHGSVANKSIGNETNSVISKKKETALQ